MSMKVNELQVGNWVKLNDPLQSGYSQVIGYFNGMVATKSETVSAKVRIENIEAISITKEWLHKNGFTKLFDGAIPSDYYEVTIDDCEVTISQGGNISNEHWHVHIDNCDRCSIANADILYVHQMQNLLNLVGINSEFMV